MKKGLLLALAAMMSVGAFAQKGEMSVGLRGNYYRAEHGIWANQSDKKGQFGLGVQFNFGITDHLRMAPNVNYFFEKDGLSSYDANFDFHYLIPVVPRLQLYPIVGATMAYAKMDGDVKSEDTEWGANLGAGVQFDVCRNWYLHADYTYKAVSNLDRSNVALGVGFKF